MKKIYLAGGCFWGVQKYFDLIKGVIKTEVGYANGKQNRTNYLQVCMGSGHTECVNITYDETKITLEELLNYYYHIIDPTSINKQGNDKGIQYRTGIYYEEENDLNIIKNSINALQKKYETKIVIEVEPLKNFIKAERFHQNYLDKHPNGYCHIPKSKFEEMKDYEIQNNIDKLTDLQYQVTKNNKTEPPFQNEYWNHFEEGIYVDIITGEPLFSSNDKFESSCGWPSFSKPIKKESILKHLDLSKGMVRDEVKSSYGKNHLGHVFSDGPLLKGGKRYCINSASLRFIPKDRMIMEGYENYLKYLK